MEEAVGYRERLHAPLRWWVQATMFLATMWLAFIVSMPPVLAWSASGALCLITYALLAYIGRVRIRVADGELLAGRGRIPVAMTGTAQALDREQTREIMGVGADARAWLVTRPYVKTSVRVPVTDEGDPTPYWLISTRHPSRLVEALARV